VLDEPNSNLDAEGEAALNQAIADLRARGAITALVAHRPSALRQANKVLVLQHGRVSAFGDRDEVLSRMVTASGTTPIRAPQDGEGEERAEASR